MNEHHGSSQSLRTLTHLPHIKGKPFLLDMFMLLAIYLGGNRQYLREQRIIKSTPGNRYLFHLDDMNTHRVHPPQSIHTMNRTLNVRPHKIHNQGIDIYPLTSLLFKSCGTFKTIPKPTTPPHEAILK